MGFQWRKQTPDFVRAWDREWRWSPWTRNPAARAREVYPWRESEGETVGEQSSRERGDCGSPES
jgi:hypothetical protein